MPFRYSPVPELKVEISETPAGSLKLSTPWHEALLEFAPEHERWVRKQATRLRECVYKKSWVDDSLVDFITPFIDSPFWILGTWPRYKGGDPLVLDMDTTDPVLGFSVLKWMRKKDSRIHEASSRLIEAIEDLRTAGQEVTRKALTVLLVQAHYITATCGEALKPALDAFPMGQEKLLRFIRSEEGHHELVADSLRGMGSFPGSQEVLEPVRVLMALLQYCASAHHLALCSLIDLFESMGAFTTNEGGKKPFWSLFDFLPNHEQLLAGVLRHGKINAEACHEKIALELVAEGPVMAKGDLLSAIEITDQAIELFATINLKLAGIIQPERAIARRDRTPDENPLI